MGSLWTKEQTDGLSGTGHQHAASGQQSPAPASSNGVLEERLQRSAIFLERAQRLAAQGLAVIPLRRNEEGFAKIPVVKAWQNVTPELVLGLDWSTAEGIGLVLGANSGNRGAIDVDDEVLAADIVAYFAQNGVRPLMTRTARRRLHVHIIEPTPSNSRVLKLLYQGRKVGVELKATGTQVAIPPTPGYSWVDEDAEPLYCPLSDAWLSLATALNVKPDLATYSRGSAGYPRPFQAHVERGERNNAIFVESCRLAEAGVPMDIAMVFVTKRIAAAFDQGGLTRREIDRTIFSAYRRIQGRTR
jgi:hypothetical protein